MALGEREIFHCNGERIPRDFGSPVAPPKLVRDSSEKVHQEATEGVTDRA